MKVPGFRCERIVVMHLVFWFRIGTLDPESQIIVGFHISNTIRVVIVVPRRYDLLASHKLDGKHEIVRRYWLAVRPTSFRV